MEKKLHMIGNAHLDPVWLWRWQDGYNAARATFRSVLDRMNEYPDFVFTSAAVCYYEWIERCDPQMFEEIRQRVKEGRWRMVGGWWIQPDCNIPSGEGFARQALIAQRYLQEKFGVMARTGYNVDSFGHSGSLPKILKLSGMDRYVYMRPGVHERTYPGWTFHWDSPEGERVTAFRIPFEYCTWPKEIAAHIDRCADEICDENGMMCFYGVGNHGGGPTKQNIESIHALDGRNGVALTLSSPDQYFDQVDESRLPVVNGDLLHHASGCYAAHSGVKKWNRLAENRLATAEKWSVLANALTGLTSRDGELRAAWKKVLFNQFHDILAGTSIVEAYDDARQDYGYALSVADDVINEAIQTIAGRISTPFEEGSQHYLVFNPHAFEASYPVQLEIALPKEECDLLDAQGNIIPHQLLAPSAAARGRVKLCFVAKVPAMGWARFTMKNRPQKEEVESLVSNNMGCQENEDAPNPWMPVLENELVRVEFDPVTGEMTSLIRKETGEEMLRLPTRTVIFDDTSDTWSHAKFHFTGKEEAIDEASVVQVADGEAVQIIRVTQRKGASTIQREYALYQGLEQVYVRTRLNWQETQKCLKFAYPLRMNYIHVTNQSPYGFTDRELDGEEYPMQQWVDASGCTSGMETRPSGLAILNDCKYAFDTHDRTLFFTVLRSPYYANHEPFVVDPAKDDFPVIDRGEQEFMMVLWPHAGGHIAPQLDQQALLLNASPILLPEYGHAGDLKPCQSLMTAEGSVLLDAMKLAEDGSGDVILHLHETARQHCDATVKLPVWDMTVTRHFTPGQVRALRINPQQKTVADTDLLERPLD